MNKKELLIQITRTAGWLFASAFVGAAICLHGALHAEAPVKASKSVDANPKAPGNPITRSTKPVPSVGFDRGRVFLSFLGGKALAPTGSLIEHEKKYDEIVRDGIQLGAYGSTSVYQPSFAIHSYYTGGGSGQIDLEYGTWSNIGMGVSLLHFTIKGNRQDVFMFPAGALPSGTSLYEPMPRDRNLYQGSSLMYLLTWHPLRKRALDPYVAFRAGVTGFTGHGHARLTPDMNRYSSKIRNGLGGILGAGLGLNWYWNEIAGIKIEATYYRQILKADQFQRSLGTVHLQAGFTVNLESTRTSN